MFNPTRRQFLSSAAAFGSAACLAPFLLRANDAEPHIVFPPDSRSRISIAAWPFRAYIESPTNSDRDPKLPGMDLKDFPAYVKEKFNVTAVEPYNLHFSSTDPSYLSEFRSNLSKSGVRAVNIAADLESSYYDADPATRASAVAEAKKWIDVAVAIGSPSVRTSMPSAKNSKPDLDRAAESITQVAAYGASNNVVVHLENDNLVSEDAFFIEKLIKQVNHPFLHALPDFGNSLGSGDPAFAARAMKALFPLAYAISHVKPLGFAGQGRELQADLAGTFAIARAAKYRGYFSMEYEGPEEVHAATTKLIEQSIKLM